MLTLDEEEALAVRKEVRVAVRDVPGAWVGDGRGRSPFWEIVIKGPVMSGAKPKGPSLEHLVDQAHPDPGPATAGIATFRVPRTRPNVPR